ncbi:hypothetical protein IID62_07040 [candidate division KSB1 bacterium]|nr:hypothetical protein [candidate division KSB1 bacterium]
MGYKLYSADNTNGIYLEVGYNINDHISLFIGGITNASVLNFSDDKGITNIGINASKDLMITDRFTFPLEISLIVNPNYRNISKVPGVGQNPVNFVVSVVF